MKYRTRKHSFKSFNLGSSMVHLTYAFQNDCDIWQVKIKTELLEVNIAYNHSSF